MAPAIRTGADDAERQDALVSSRDRADSQDQRFAFGRNWAKLLARIDADAIERARQSLVDMLGLSDLAGRSFLDVGSGSGLFSLAARGLRARVVSFDFDPQSVACAEELKRRYHAGDPDWTIRTGSILDDSFVGSLGTFDIVYSWGVLHHTGDLLRGLDAVTRLVKEGGLLYLALYNDQGRESGRWLRIKRVYNRLPRILRFLVLAPALVRIWGPTSVRDLLRGKPFATWRDYPRENRGMHPWRDLVDWVGGYPFEVARPEQIIDFYQARGFALRRLKTCGGGRGCNEFVFSRSSASPA